MNLRGRREFEQPTNLHCSIAFTLYQSTAVVGLMGRARIFGAELDALMQALAASTPGSYDSLSLPDQQVRKKLFWLNFFIRTHARLGDLASHHLDWLPIPDTMFYDPATLDAILPLPVDDEYIKDDTVLPQPSDYVGITAGFLGIIRIFLCFVAPMAGNPRGRVINAVEGIEYVSSVETPRQRVDRKASDDLQDMLLRIHRVADHMPRPLALWLDPNFQPAEVQQALADQLASMRANIHVTRLWARYLIFDRLVAVQEALYGKAVTNRSLIISEHEAICDDLLQFLASVTIRNLESNGVTISFKIRQVAALLLDYSSGRSQTSFFPGSPQAASPDEQHQHRLAERADSLIDKFLTLLTQMDSATFQDSQMMLCSQMGNSSSEINAAVG
ncbi:uncharacterized protein AB675_216 [Cyphellophora attinorum]|uniref:Transcription factor domain-containing protein n=1 Tax=Cyphellophora attinorum TaxID=1664694 RepID=A0A0N0NKD1_9EURO|nr:uncharacterized protein AB675_216 [Phialophora attinorum]KPI37699.1 hypothetical protein AB675_216 [Phialophora attinorum]